MIEILSKTDVEKISDPVLRAGVLKEFDRLPDDYKYPEYGYFIVIERLEELTDPVELNSILAKYTTRSLVNCLELTEGFDGYFQILLILDADFGLSLFVREKTLCFVQLSELFSI